MFSKNHIRSIEGCLSSMSRIIGNSRNNVVLSVTYASEKNFVFKRRLRTLTRSNLVFSPEESKAVVRRKINMKTWFGKLDKFIHTSNASNFWPKKFEIAWIND